MLATSDTLTAISAAALCPCIVTLVSSAHPTFGSITVLLNGSTEPLDQLSIALTNGAALHHLIAVVLVVAPSLTTVAHRRQRL